MKIFYEIIVGQVKNLVGDLKAKCDLSPDKSLEEWGYWMNKQTDCALELSQECMLFITFTGDKITKIQMLNNCDEISFEVDYMNEDYFISCLRQGFSSEKNNFNGYKVIRAMGEYRDDTYLHYYDDLLN